MTRRPKPSRRMFPHKVDIVALDTERTGHTGGLKPSSTPFASNVTCLISEKKGGRQWVGMQEVEVKSVRVLFPDPIDLRLSHQIHYLDNFGQRRIFQVMTFRDDLNLGRIWIAEVEEDVAQNREGTQ